MPNFVGDALMAHAKGGCYRCGRGDNLVDLDAQIEGEGALVLCIHCIGEAAESGGLHLNAAAVAEIRADHAEERRTFGPERIAELEAQVAAAEHALEVERAVVDRLTSAQAPKARSKA